MKAWTDHLFHFNLRKTLGKLLTLFSLSFSFTTFSQSSIEVSLKGNVSDSIRSIPLPYTPVSIYNGNTLIHVSETDTEGSFNIQLKVPSGKNKLSIVIQPKYYSSYTVALDSNLQNTVNWEKTIRLEPQKICSDSFLPTPIYFAENTTVLDKKDEMRLLTELFHINEQLQFMFAKKSLELVAYCDYNEKPKIAEKRMLYIYNMALEAGFKQVDLRMKVLAKRELYVCDYCDGCHYFYLKGQGISLSQNQYQKLETPEEQEIHLAKRRTVQFNWVDKKGY